MDCLAARLRACTLHCYLYQISLIPTVVVVAGILCLSPGHLHVGSIRPCHIALKFLSYFSPPEPGVVENGAQLFLFGYGRVACERLTACL